MEVWLGVADPGQTEVGQLLTRVLGAAACAWALPTIVLGLFLLARGLRWWLHQGRKEKANSGGQRRSQPPSLSGGDRRSGAAARDNAQLCWARIYGRYKYCGLRPEPLASQSPPVYSLTNLDIPLPDDMSDEELQALGELGRRVADLKELSLQGPGMGGFRTDDATLLRYLRARKGKVAQAEALLREAAALRQECDVDRVFTHWDFDAYERCLAPWWIGFGLVGHGKKGEPVAVERLGICNYPSWFRQLPDEVLLRIDLLHGQRCLAALEEDALRRNKPLIPSILIMDFRDFGWDQIQLSAARSLSRLINYRNLLLTETSGRIIIVRSPAAFARAWGLFSYLLDAGVRDKVQVVSCPEKSLEVIRKYVDDDVIPAFLGGSKTIHGDPDCSVQIAPGGVPPAEAIERLLAMTTCDGAVLPAAKDKPVSFDSEDTIMPSSSSSEGSVEDIDSGQSKAGGIRNRRGCLLGCLPAVMPPLRGKRPS